MLRNSVLICFVIFTIQLIVSSSCDGGSFDDDICGGETLYDITDVELSFSEDEDQTQYLELFMLFDQSSTSDVIFRNPFTINSAFCNVAPQIFYNDEIVNIDIYKSNDSSFVEISDSIVLRQQFSGSSDDWISLDDYIEEHDFHFEAQHSFDLYLKNSPIDTSFSYVADVTLENGGFFRARVD